MTVAVRDLFQAENIQSDGSDNVVMLHLRVLPRHMSEAANWVRAGGRMGLLDAAVSEHDGQALVVWVRESSEPAYLVRADRMDWVVTDRATGRTMGAFQNFSHALQCIRPVGAASPGSTKARTRH